MYAFVNESASLQACTSSSVPRQALVEPCQAPDQETEFSCLPTGVLRRILSVIVHKPHDDLQAFQTLRGCSKELRVVSDDVRTHIAFSVGQLADVGPYLHKLPCLRAVTITHRAEETMGVDNYSLLPSLVPGLRYLHLNCVRNSNRVTQYQGPRMAVEDLGTLLQPWSCNLRTLRLHSCSFTTAEGGFLDSLDFLSGLPALVNLELRNVTPSATLNLDGCTALKQLDCSDNELKTLSVDGCSALEKLTCRKNQLVSLSLALCHALQYLYCDSNRLSAIDVSDSPSLHELDCQDNKGITSLDLSHHHSLRKLLCAGNIPLNLKACTALQRLDISDTVEHALDLENFTALQYLRCRIGIMGSLKVTGCGSLHEMHCNGSDLLSSLDLSGCGALRKLSVFNCRLACLDLSGCTLLQELYCSFSGRLDTLDLSSCSSLHKVSVCNCRVVSLNLQSCKLLADLNCSANDLLELNLSSCAVLKVLQCGQNKLRGLDVSACPCLDKLDISSSSLLETLSTRNCSQLAAVECDDCPLLKERIARTDSEGYDEERTVRVVITSNKVLKVVDIKPEAMKTTPEELSKRVLTAMQDAHNEHRRSYKFL